MESNRRRRRRRDNKPKPPKSKKTVESSSLMRAATTSTVHDVPDHLLEVILLRLDSFVSLVRAASACKRWCRVVADAEFLSLFHPLPAAPLILGHYYDTDEQQLEFVPSSTPSIRESLSLDFVPTLDGAWEIADSRATLLLLSKKDWTTPSSSGNSDLVVCRPVTRMYQAISLPERDRLADRQCLGLFLAGGGGGGGGGSTGGSSIGLSKFRVMAVLLRDHMLVPGRGVPVACVYEGRWGWRDVSCTRSGGDISVPNTAGSFCFAGRADGRLYWVINSDRAMLVLDEATTGVSLVAIPAVVHSWYWYARSRCFRVIGGGGGEDGGAVALRAILLTDHDLVYARLRVGDEWALQNLLPFPQLEQVPGAPPWNAVIVAAHETYILVRPQNNVRLCSVDLKTMAAEFVPQGIMDSGGAAYPYELPWPPTLDVDVETEAAADNISSDPKNTEQGGDMESTSGYQIPYTQLKATQNIARLSFRSTCVIL